MATNINRILFDYDGTLLLHDETNEGEKIADMLGLDAEKAAIFSNQLIVFFEGHNIFLANKVVTYELYLSILERLIPCIFTFNLSSKQVDDAINLKAKQYSVLANDVCFILEYLTNKGYKLGIITNGFYNTQTNNMKYHGVFEYFEQIFTWDNFYAKPDLRFMRKALAGTEPRRNALIGDSIVNDMLMAKRAGVFSIWYNRHDTIHNNIKPDKSIKELIELKNIF